MYLVDMICRNGGEELGSRCWLDGLDCRDEVCNGSGCCARSSLIRVRSWGLYIYIGFVIYMDQKLY